MAIYDNHGVYDIAAFDEHTSTLLNLRCIDIWFLGTILPAVFIPNCSIMMLLGSLSEAERDHKPGISIKEKI